MSNRRRIILINPKFQLRFVFYVSSWVVALSFFYPWIISNILDYLIQYLALDPTGPALVNLEKSRQDLFWLLALMELALIGTIITLSLFMSHRIAGPLYKLKMFFKQVKAGNFAQRLSFRKRDYFKDLIPEYNEMMDAVQTKFEQKSEGIRLAIPRIERVLKQSNLETQLELEAALEALREAEKS